MCRLLLVQIGVVLCAGWCSKAMLWAQQPPSTVLNDVTAESGIDFLHSDGSQGQFYLIESMSAGLALLDFDQDGDLDVYFLNGAPVVQGAEPHPKGNALYRNDGNWKFTDVTDSASVGDARMGLGVATADYDNDGFADIYVNNYGANTLYRNNGDGTYQELTTYAGVANGQRVGGGVSFFDMDADGDLDLYVGNYIRFEPAQHQVHFHKGLPAYPSPRAFDADTDTLFENMGDGSFRDVSASSGIAAVAGRSMGLVTFDQDDDGDIDVMVANDTQENFLFRNDGRGHFEEVALLSGLALDFKGNAQASMGLALVDLDQDTRLDLLMTSFAEEFVTFYRNVGNGSFEDATLQAGASEATFPHVTWGIVAADFDNNATPDVLIAAGHLDPLRERRGGTSSATGYRVPNLLLNNLGRGKLVDLARAWGSGAEVANSTRGLVCGDLDNDGRLDVVALNSNGPPSLLRNESMTQGSFVKIRLIGTNSNRDGLGAKVEIEQLGLKQVAQLHSGHSYQSDGPRLLHFGVTSASEPATIKVRWPSGKTSMEVIKAAQTGAFWEPR